MAHTYKYELCNELRDCSLSEPWATYPTKRMALQVARECAKNMPWDALNVVVMNSVEQIAVAVFRRPK